MTATNRSAQFAKIHKVLKKHYKSVSANPKRTVMEQLLFACCLEDAQHEAAEEAFAALVHTFFDWNEVRVTSISELSEVMACLPDPRLAANRIKRVLHAIFETQFNFDLDDKRKKNLGPTIKWLESLDGATPFSVAYVVQTALAGHFIPIGKATLNLLHLLEMVSEKDMAGGVVPGLERAIQKSKGIEFGSLLHQFGADFSANPYSPKVRGIILEINPAVQSRLPKRRKESQLRKKALPGPQAEMPAKSKRAQKPARSEKAKKRSQTEQTAGLASKKTKKKPAAKQNISITPSANKPSSRRQPSLKKKTVSQRLSKRKPR